MHGLNNEASPKRKMWFCPLGGVAAGGRGHRQEQGIGSKGRERRGTEFLGGHYTTVIKRSAVANK